MINNEGLMQLNVIGIIHSCFREKFGIPRQPGMVVSATAELELVAPYNREEMVRGLEGFSHIWVQFVFHDTVREGWKPTIRPPWQGGKKKVGVFASRSPHRPNHLGLSVVRLDKIDLEEKRVVLYLSGIDFLDGTPVVDIKPYLPYSDVVSKASCGYTKTVKSQSVIAFSQQSEDFCMKYKNTTNIDLRQLITELLENDPRPASQKDKKDQFGMAIWDVNVVWRVENTHFYVEECHFVE